MTKAIDQQIQLVITTNDYITDDAITKLALAASEGDFPLIDIDTPAYNINTPQGNVDGKWAHEEEFGLWAAIEKDLQTKHPELLKQIKTVDLWGSWQEKFTIMAGDNQKSVAINMELRFWVDDFINDDHLKQLIQSIEHLSSETTPTLKGALITALEERDEKLPAVIDKVILQLTDSNKDNYTFHYG